MFSRAASFLIILSLLFQLPAEAMRLKSITMLADDDPASQNGKYITQISLKIEDERPNDPDFGKFDDFSGDVEYFDHSGLLSIIVIGRIIQEQAAIELNNTILEEQSFFSQRHPFNQKSLSLIF